MPAENKKLEITTSGDASNTRISAFNVHLEDENRLRFLALELAKGIYEPSEILEKLGWTEEDYNEISQSRVFKAMLNQSISEWRGAGNTKKRVQLKSIINIEAALPNFYTAMINPNEPLMARVKTLEILGKLGGLGGSEAVVGPNGGGGNGQYFKLEIHMDRGAPPIVIDGGVIESGTLASSDLAEVGSTPELTPESNEIDHSNLSSLLADQPWEEL